MKSLLITFTVFALLEAQIAHPQNQRVSEPRGFQLRFPRSINPSDLSISYSLTGPFGQYGGFLKTEPDKWDYLIPTKYEEKQAQTLKAILYCKGYGIELLSFPSLDFVFNRSANIEFKALSMNHLSGRINWPKARSIKKTELEVYYLAYWSHEFYGYIDGPVVMFKIESARVARDGSFSLTFPDFGQDVTANSFKLKGMIKLIARDFETGNMSYRLERPDQPGREFEIDIAAGYSGELILNAREK